MSRTADHAFEALYRRHRGELYRWLLRETGDAEVAEDVLQTAFMHAYRALLKGEPPREPRSWLFAIARNANRGRFRRRRIVESEYADDLPLSRDDSPDDLGVPELKEALATLPPNQRAAIVLQEVGGFSYVEIAERLDLTVASVQMLVFRARRKLRTELLGERRLAGAFLPVQPLVNLLSRLSPAGDRAVLLRGAAGVLGTVAIGGGVLATSGGASPTVRGEAKAPVALVEQVPAPHLRGPATAKSTTKSSPRATSIAKRTVRHRSPARRNPKAPRPAVSTAARAAQAPAAGSTREGATQPAAGPTAKPPVSRAVNRPVSRIVSSPVTRGAERTVVRTVPTLPNAPAQQPKLPPAPRVPPVALPQVPTLPNVPAPRPKLPPQVPPVALPQVPTLPNMPAPRPKLPPAPQVPPVALPQVPAPTIPTTLPPQPTVPHVTTTPPQLPPVPRPQVPSVGVPQVPPAPAATPLPQPPPVPAPALPTLVKP